MTPSAPSPAQALLAKQAREQFVAHATGVLSGMATAITERMVALIDQSESTREAQTRRDSLMAFRQLNTEWTQSSMAAWRNALLQPSADNTRSRELRPDGVFHLLHPAPGEPARRCQLELLDQRPSAAETAPEGSG